MKFRSMKNCHGVKSGFLGGEGMVIKREVKYFLFVYSFLYYLDFLEFI